MLAELRQTHEEKQLAQENSKIHDFGSADSTGQELFCRINSTNEVILVFFTKQEEYRCSLRY